MYAKKTAWFDLKALEPTILVCIEDGRVLIFLTEIGTVFVLHFKGGNKGWKYSGLKKGKLTNPMQESGQKKRQYPTKSPNKDPEKPSKQTPSK